MNGSEEKAKLALYWAASCGGCEIAALGIEEKILDVAAKFDIVLWPCVVDGKVRDIERMDSKSIDVCLFNGSIRTSEQEYMARLLRDRSKVLVAFGSQGNRDPRPQRFVGQGVMTRKVSPQGTADQSQHHVVEGDAEVVLDPHQVDQRERTEDEAARVADVGVQQ